MVLLGSLLPSSQQGLVPVLAAMQHVMSMTTFAKCNASCWNTCLLARTAAPCADRTPVRGEQHRFGASARYI
jgi:hypothetical protein